MCAAALREDPVSHGKPLFEPGATLTLYLWSDVDYYYKRRTYLFVLSLNIFFCSFLKRCPLFSSLKVDIHMFQSVMADLSLNQVQN